MPSESPPTPSRTHLVLFALAGLTVAGGVAGYGILGRSRSDAAVAQWTKEQLVPTVSLARLAQGDATQPLTLPGNIQPFYKASIYARVSGYVKDWSRDIGADVKAGDVLATIEAPDLDQQLAQAQATLASAKANSDVAAITAGRNDVLVKKQIVAQQMADQTNADAAGKEAITDAMAANVRQLQAMLAYKRIVAPFDGVVTARNTDIGALISAGSAGQALFEVSDLHRVRIFVRVPQSYSAQIRPGLKATFEMPQYPGRRFEAAVITTSKAFDAASRSMQVELQADNAEGLLFAGAYAQVHFELSSNPNAFRLPATALVSVNRGTQVALLGSDNTVTLQPIQLGRDFGDSVEVVAGLSPSDRVIDSPPETLQPGDRVQLPESPPPAQAGPAVAEAGPDQVRPTPTGSAADPIAPPSRARVSRPKASD